MTVPEWMRPITAAAHNVRSGDLSSFVPPADGSARSSAVLLLFGESSGNPDILLTERAAGLRRHAGETAFPGGTVDPTDAGPAEAALREGAEETGLDPSGVDVLTTLPPLWIPVTNFAVTPVLAWWREPSAVSVVDETEVASVRRVPLRELVRPANRLRVRLPTGTLGPAFRACGLFVWGFTAGVLSRLFEASGIDEPWDTSKVERLPEPPAIERRSSDHGEGRGATCFSG